MNNNLSNLNNLHKKTVAFLGPIGTYSYFAAQEIFEGNTSISIDYIALPSIFDVFKKVQSGEVNLGVIPIENSIEGMVKDSINLFLNQNSTLSGQYTNTGGEKNSPNRDKEVIIVKEHTLEIDHCLLSKGLYMQDVKVVRAHSQALGQCKNWLSTHMPRANLIAENSNLSGIKNLDATGREAVIASRKVAKDYELNILAEHMSDKQNNKTLFYVITQNTNNFFKKETLVADIERHVRDDGAKKIIFLLEADDKIGILRDLLGVFAKYSAPVARIQSLPTGELGTYYFLVDVDIEKAVGHIKSVYLELASQCINVRVLGVV